MKPRLFPHRLQDQRRGNRWSNTVWLAAVGGVLLLAGGPLGLLQPWNDAVGDGVRSIGAIEVIAEREIIDPGGPAEPVGLHTYFGIAETEEEIEEPAANVREINGGWTYLDTGVDCAEKPELSIRLRQNDSGIFGYGLVAPTACGTHAPDDLDYTVIKGTHKDGQLVLTIVEKTRGHALYHFTGTVSSEGLVGKLAFSDGRHLADGLVFLPSGDDKI